VSDRGPDPLGKRALFWAPAERAADPVLPGEEPEDAGKYALFSRFSDGLDDQGGQAPGAPAGPGPAGLVAPVEVHCSSCGATSQVDLARYLLLHLPFFFWRPGRGFTRFMTCPACRRRTWVSASWTPWPAR
jgi:hypothetical protein